MIIPGGIIGGAIPSVILTDTGSLNTAVSTYTFSSRALGTAGRRHIVVTVGYYGSANVTGCTVAGVTATQIAATSVLTVKTAMYIVSLPTGTSGDVVVTLSGVGAGCHVGVYAAYDLRSATPVDTATNAVNGAVPTYTLGLDADVAARGIVVATFTGVGVTTITPIGLNNQASIFTSGGTVVRSADYTGTVAETPRTMGWTVNQDTAGCLATFR
jgi:hypothetical protein